MKLSHPSNVVLLLLLVGTLGPACAAGTDAAEPGPSGPRQTTAPSEPPPSPPGESGPLPPTNGGADGGSNTGDSGTTPNGPGSCATTPPSNACGLAPQCGCSAGQTCEVTNRFSGDVSCVTAGDGPLAAPCTATSQCKAGLTCERGVCRPYCAAPGSACADGVGACEASRDSAGTAIPNANVCSIPCNLLDPTAACGASSCVWNGTGAATDCRAVGTKVEDEACTKVDECAQGLACAKLPVIGSHCVRWCRVNSQTDCAALETCVNIYGSGGPTQDGAPLGHCQ